MDPVDFLDKEDQPKVPVNFCDECHRPITNPDEFMYDPETGAVICEDCY